MLDRSLSRHRGPQLRLTLRCFNTHYILCVQQTVIGNGRQKKKALNFDTDFNIVHYVERKTAVKKAKNAETNVRVSSQLDEEAAKRMRYFGIR